MRTLHRYAPETNNASNFRYITALMIEARTRGYPLLDATPEFLSESGPFVDYINEITDWLVNNYPDEFERG